MVINIIYALVKSNLSVSVYWVQWHFVLHILVFYEIYKINNILYKNYPNILLTISWSVDLRSSFELKF